MAEINGVRVLWLPLIHKRVVAWSGSTGIFGIPSCGGVTICSFLALSLSGPYLCPHKYSSNECADLSQERGWWFVGMADVLFGASSACRNLNLRHLYCYLYCEKVKDSCLSSLSKSVIFENVWSWLARRLTTREVSLFYAESVSRLYKSLAIDQLKPHVLRHDYSYFFKIVSQVFVQYSGDNQGNCEVHIGFAFPAKKCYSTVHSELLNLQGLV